MESALEAEFVALETQVWDAIVRQDTVRYRQLVSDEALMVIGGVRSTGVEEAEILTEIQFPPYQLSEFQVFPLTEHVTLVHYTATFTGSAPELSDFGGRYYVSSLWRHRDGTWQLVFNQDARPADVGNPES